MKVTKLEHSGIIIEKNNKMVVFDPVEYEQTIPEIENVIAIIITHKHSDHFQPEVINKILGANPNAKIFTTSDTAVLLNSSTVAKAGDIYEVGDFKFEFFGKDHAPIVPGQVPCENIGVVVDDEIINPGDSFDMPKNPAKVLLVPISAPWLKISEAMEYIEKMKPEIAIPIHDALLSKLGETISNNWVDRACDAIKADYKILRVSESIEI